MHVRFLRNVTVQGKAYFEKDEVQLDNATAQSLLDSSLVEDITVPDTDTAVDTENVSPPDNQEEETEEEGADVKKKDPEDQREAGTNASEEPGNPSDGQGEGATPIETVDRSNQEATPENSGEGSTGN